MAKQEKRGQRGRYLLYNGSRRFITMDGTDFIINEPNPSKPGFYSHKFHRAGVRYELGVSIQSGDIVRTKESSKVARK